MVEVLDNVERIKMCAPDEFRRRYMKAYRPVVVTDLFAGDRIRELADAAATKEALGSTPIQIQENYISAAMIQFAGGQPPPPRDTTIAGYLDFIEREPSTTVMSIELPTPPAVESLYRVPPLCLDAGGAPDDYRSLFFLGNAGNYASVHHDGDQRHVLLYQVFGRKRVMLIPPRSGRKIAPVNQLGSVLIQHFSDADKVAFARFSEAVDFVLHPGEAVYIPPLYWHFLDYLDTGMGFNLRWGRNRFNHFLSTENLHPNVHLQAIAAAMVDTERAEGELAPWFARIEAALAEPYANAREKVHHMDAVFREVYAGMFPDATLPYYFDNFGEIEANLSLYRYPFGTAETDPTIAVTARAEAEARRAAQRERT